MREGFGLQKREREREMSGEDYITDWMVEIQGQFCHFITKFNLVRCHVNRREVSDNSFKSKGD